MIGSKAKAAIVGTAMSGAAVAGMIGTTGPALAYDSGGLHLSATAQSPARVIANGAALRVSVNVSCNATQYPYLNVNVTEAVGRQIASGTGYANVVCQHSKPAVISVEVVAAPGRAFAPGKAVVATSLGGCLDDQTCGTDSKLRTVTLRK